MEAISFKTASKHGTIEISKFFLFLLRKSCFFCFSLKFSAMELILRVNNYRTQVLCVPSVTTDIENLSSFLVNTFSVRTVCRCGWIGKEHVQCVVQRWPKTQNGKTAVPHTSSNFSELFTYDQLFIHLNADASYYIFGCIKWLRLSTFVIQINVGRIVIFVLCNVKTNKKVVAGNWCLYYILFLLTK